jgi:hypothetical protein
MSDLIYFDEIINKSKCILEEDFYFKIKIILLEKILFISIYLVNEKI